MTSETNPHLPPTPPSEETINALKMAVNSSTEHKHIWVITGPAGCGKTSVAEYLHETFSIPYLEGDTVSCTILMYGQVYTDTTQFHTPENIEKMANGQPLTDTDRWDWLIQLREEAISALKSSNSKGVIVTCSALKRKYRDVIRIATYHDPTVRVNFVFLSASESALMDRVRARKDHYMKDHMVKSQFESLETPQQDEADVLSVDASGTTVEVQHLAVGVVKRVLNADIGKT